jgi:hypothetical protein
VDSEEIVYGTLVLEKQLLKIKKLLEGRENAGLAVHLFSLHRKDLGAEEKSVISKLMERYTELARNDELRILYINILDENILKKLYNIDISNFGLERKMIPSANPFSEQSILTTTFASIVYVYPNSKENIENSKALIQKIIESLSSIGRERHLNKI